MLTITTVTFEGVNTMLLASFEILFVILLWVLGAKAAQANTASERFWCLAGLYGCYIVMAAALFILAVPIGIENMVEYGAIGVEDSALYTAVIIAITFAVWNVTGLATVICWHCKKKRKEMSEMDKMKLNDL